MSRKSSRTPEAETPATIDPNTVYTREQLRRALGLARFSLDREVKAGRIAYADRVGRRWFRGSWVLDWFEEAKKRREQKYRRRPPDAQAEAEAA